LAGRAAIVRHNASVSRIKVYYPFHPYYGQELEVVYKPNPQEGTVTVYVKDRNHQKIPLWMVDPKASEYKLSDQAYIHFKALLSLKELIPISCRVLYNSPQRVPFKRGEYHETVESGVERVVVDGKVRKRQGWMRDPEECKVFINGHHEGYIDWEIYE